jgi:CRISPR-associated protein Csb2
MSSVLCLTFRFLDPDPRFHGRGSDGDPEWPPSPLRAYQALVAAAATKWRDLPFRETARPALIWLESVTPTIVTSPVVSDSFGYRMYVPNNSGDLMTAAWARGDTETTMAKMRVEKDVRPKRILGDFVSFLYPMGDVPTQAVFETLRATARSVTHLGWGIDQVAGDAELLTAEEAAKLAGELWRPSSDGYGQSLRAPESGTLDDLLAKYQKFLNRLQGPGFQPVPPVSAFQVVSYRSATDAVSRPWCAFQILKPDASGYRAFDPVRKCRDIAAWVRHATGEACQGWPFGDLESFVHGHTKDGKQAKGTRADERFLFLPVPSIEKRPEGEVMSAVRRVLIAAPPGFQKRIEYIQRRLPGRDLMWDQQTVGILNMIPTSDWVLQRYTGGSKAWSTATPVIWPGYDDRNPEKAEKLLRKAFVDAGLPQQIVDGIVELEWRNVGFRAGLDLASRYFVPENLNGTRYHVRVKFSHPVRGPLAVGAGRYRGFGLFAIEAG